VTRTGLILKRGLVRRAPSRHQDHAVQVKLQVSLLSADQVTEVRRVEGSAEDADAHGSGQRYREWPRLRARQYR